MKRPSREELEAHIRKRSEDKRRAQARYRQAHAKTLRTARRVMTTLMASRYHRASDVADALRAHYVEFFGTRAADKVIRKLIRELRKPAPRERHHTPSSGNMSGVSGQR